MTARMGIAALRGASGSAALQRTAPPHRLSVLRPAGKRCAVHLDGAVKGLLEKVVEAGVDAGETLTPPQAAIFPGS